ncbi:hypothetical protein [Sorangium sp. So ce1024]|uniref:hypothetical protein n=1 Tax=Sorangium sp. So ce1024 TaxID=3133327 RepID=UPI003EFEBF85
MSSRTILSVDGPPRVDRAPRREPPCEDGWPLPPHDPRELEFALDVVRGSGGVPS